MTPAPLHCATTGVSWSAVGEFLLGIALVWIAGFWIAGIVQMRRAGYYPGFPGSAVGVHVALAFGFVAGVALIIGGATRL